MKKPVAALVFLALVFVVAAAAAFLSNRVCCKMEPSHHDAHEWIHAQLGLTPDQDLRLDAIEKAYREKRRHFEREMAAANRELAEAIRFEGKDSERVHAAIGKIHSNMGELQLLTVGHVFEMRDVLTPEQYRKLLDFTADALSNLDPQHGGE